MLEAESAGEVRRYQVRELLGQGGFGSVYRADLLVGTGGFVKPVALKVLNADLATNAEVSGRLRDEARMLGRLRHRAIVQVDGLVMIDGNWTVVMEYLEGADLSEIIAEGPTPIGCALEIVAEVAAALHVAYYRPASSGEVLKLLHRDIKPGNIQLTAAGEVKVLDFGIARAEFVGREAQTRSMTFGSLPYMAPERFDSIDSHAGDVYALGVVLYELITGEPLGRTSANEGRHRRLVAAALERVSEVTHDADLAALLEQVLDYEPQRRPSAREFEKAARRQRRNHPEPELQDHAEECVPLIRARRALAVASPPTLVGRMLVETTTSPVDDDADVTWDLRTTWESDAFQAAIKGPPAPRSPRSAPNRPRVRTTTMALFATALFVFGLVGTTMAGIGAAIAFGALTP